MFLEIYKWEKFLYHLEAEKDLKSAAPRSCRFLSTTLRRNTTWYRHILYLQFALTARLRTKAASADHLNI